MSPKANVPWPFFVGYNNWGVKKVGLIARQISQTVGREHEQRDKAPIHDVVKAQRSRYRDLATSGQITWLA